jgi:hypothetical protein
MLDDYQLDQTIRLAVFDLMLVLYKQGITKIHMGGMMRILGVENEVAQEYDDDEVLLDDSFVKYIEEINKPIPPDQTLH